MGKLKRTSGHVRSTLEKLPRIRADLVRLDNDWQEWKFGQFAEVLRQWTERNPISYERKRLDNSKKGRLFSTKQYGNKINGCVHCNKDHKSIQCKAVTDTNKRREILREKNSVLIVQGRNIERVNVRVNRPVEFVTENTIHSFVIRIRVYY